MAEAAKGGEEFAESESRTWLHEVYRLSDALHRTATLQEFHELAVDGVMRISGAPRAAILVMDDAGVMRFRAWRGISATYRQAVEGHNPWGPKAVDPAPVVVPDVAADAALAPFLERITAEGIGAVAFLPIVMRDGALAGKFMVYFDAPHAMSALELEAARAVANHVGFALERKEAERRLRDERQLFVEGPVVVFRWRMARGWPVDFVSSNVEQLTGHAQADWLSGRVAFKAIVHADDIARVEAEIATHFASHSERFAQEYRIVRADGAVRWVRDFTRILRDGDGAVAQFHGYLLDVTDERARADRLRELTADLESRVAERTAALEEAMHELEAFTYSVSHDLRSPLRWIDSYSALLRESTAPHLDADAEAMFAKIRGATRRMSMLVDDLLALTRIAKVPVARVPVNLSRLAAEIAAALQEGAPGRRVEWEIAPDLLAEADAGLARLLMENLLANAWKFTGQREHARICVGREPAADGGRFYVRDNGIGFDMQHAANIFEPFHRLHSAEAFPGTGIGLATVQRIVRRHGGAIDAWAAPDEGAAFRFSLAP
ncbi:MAG: PAS domain-containing protein [Burkholderiales bacterium]|nr:PAS domain-containing protein [Burkholderiales bacterium]